MLDERQRFKLGFITRCIEEGITTPDDICQRAKEAADRLETAPADAEKAAFDWTTPMMMLAGTAAVAPPILGGAIGYGMGRASDIDDDDVEEARRQELIEELRRQTTKLKRQRSFSFGGASKDKTPAGLF